MAAYQQESGPQGLTEADARTNTHRTDVAQSSDQRTVQGADDNPRPLIPGTSLAEQAHVPMPPVVSVDDIPQPFSNSSWARRNARAKRLSQRIPKHIRDHEVWTYVLLILVLVLVFFAGSKVVLMFLQDGMHLSLLLRLCYQASSLCKRSLSALHSSNAS